MSQTPPEKKDAGAQKGEREKKGGSYSLDVSKGHLSQHKQGGGEGRTNTRVYMKIRGWKKRRHSDPALASSWMKSTG